MPSARPFVSPDGVPWTVELLVPSHSSAMVMFHHPGGTTARLDRYAWLNSRGPEANDPRARLNGKPVLERMSDAEIAKLFRRSMPVHTERASYIVS